MQLTPGKHTILYCLKCNYSLGYANIQTVTTVDKGDF